jgi:hypothetical protein
MLIHTIFVLLPVFFSRLLFRPPRFISLVIEAGLFASIEVVFFVLSPVYVAAVELKVQAVPPASQEQSDLERFLHGQCVEFTSRDVIKEGIERFRPTNTAEVDWLRFQMKADFRGNVMRAQLRLDNAEHAEFFLKLITTAYLDMYNTPKRNSLGDIDLTPPRFRVSLVEPAHLEPILDVSNKMAIVAKVMLLPALILVLAILAILPPRRNY